MVDRWARAYARDMSTPQSSYLLAEPHLEMAVLDVPEIPTAVSTFTDLPMTDMARAFDATFTALFPPLEAEGIRPAGPAFSRHSRMPTDSVDMQVGIPVDRALPRSVTTDSGITVIPSTLPAGRIAIVSHLGPFDGLGDAWARFMQAVSDAGHTPALPFWEVYVTEPSPDMDPATLRTDLVTLLG